MLRFLLGFALALGAADGVAAHGVSGVMGASGAGSSRVGLRVEKTVLLYRHGVRAPLEPEAALEDLPHQPLPAWPVAPGLLTPHGGLALERIGAWRRAQFRRDGLWHSACPTEQDLAIWTNTAARTIASGEALARGLAPGCAVGIGHLPVDQTDPLFEPMRLRNLPFDGAAALHSIAEYTGGPAAMATRHGAALRELARVIGCDQTAQPCDLGADAGRVALSDDGHEVALSGAIRKYSGTAQVFLLEYLEGLPMAQVGWGRASPAALRRLAPLHAALFDVYTRPPYMAARVAGPLALRIAAILRDPHAPKVSIFMGHDSNVSALAALLGVKITSAGYAPGDPPPGGALAIEVLRDAHGRRWARMYFEAAGPEQIRHLTRLTASRPPSHRMLTLPACGHARCSLGKLLNRIESGAVR
jgi:4-phytase/acid phosphatase